jgi:hypothetical protein
MVRIHGRQRREQMAHVAPEEGQWMDEKSSAAELK